MHKGEWAIHEVLPSLLSDIGPAHVKIATFSISEDSLRPLFFLSDEKKIESLTLLLDTTVKRHKLDLLLFASNISPRTTDGKTAFISLPESISSISQICLIKRMKTLSTMKV